MTKLKTLLYWTLFIGIIFFDRLTKHIALSMLNFGGKILNNLMSFHIVFNRGISWGMFNSSQTSTFIIVSSAIFFLTLVLAGYAWLRYYDKRLVVGEVLVVAGSISNLVDRIIYHGVVDFIQLSFHGWSWPIFNLADCCIVLGVIVMIIEHYKSL